MNTPKAYKDGIVNGPTCRVELTPTNDHGFLDIRSTEQAFVQLPGVIRKPTSSTRFVVPMFVLPDKPKEVATRNPQPDRKEIDE